MVNNKLIRLHTTTDDGLFDCIFNDEIKVEPNSQICLQSCNLSRSMESLVIDATNDLIKYQIQATQGEQQVRLKHGTYTRTNILELFQDLQDKINTALDIEFSKNNGTQFNIHIDSSEKVVFQFGYKPLFDWVRNSASAGVSSTGVNTNANELKRDVTTASQNLFDSAIWGRVPFTKGCGVFRCRVKSMVDQANGGFIMALVDKDDYPKITAGTLTEADIFLGIKVPADPTDNILTISNGVEADSGETLRRYTAGGGNDNDILEIQLDGKIFYPMLHTTNPADVNSPESEFLIAGGVNYNAEKEYYCLISLFSGSNNLRLNRVGHMPDPFEQTPPNLEGEFKLENELGAPSPPSFNRQDTVYNLTFETFGVADYLGFRSVEQNRQRTPTAEGNFRANRAIKNIVISDSYLIELLNLPLDSYDSLTNGRKNILASIPISERILTNTGLIQYEPNTPLFIDLKNEFPLTLRNIRARVTTDDFQEIITEGLSTISIVVKSKE